VPFNKASALVNPLSGLTYYEYTKEFGAILDQLIVAGIVGKLLRIHRVLFVDGYVGGNLIIKDHEDAIYFKVYKEKTPPFDLWLTDYPIVAVRANIDLLFDATVNVIDFRLRLWYDLIDA